MDAVQEEYRAFPDWWRRYAAEFPEWHVWRGVAGLVYARRVKSSPPRVVRSCGGASGLRDQILAEMADREEQQRRWAAQHPRHGP